MLQICVECTTAYSVGALACPHCDSTDWIDEGAEIGADGPAEEVDPEPDES